MQVRMISINGKDSMCLTDDNGVMLNHQTDIEVKQIMDGQETVTVTFVLGDHNVRFCPQLKASMTRG